MNDIAVVIAARGACEQMHECLSSVFSQTHAVSEIIVVDDGLTDAARDVVSAFAGRVTLLKNDGDGASAARNNGVSHTQATYVVFIDADCIAEKDLIEELLTGIQSGDFSACGGVQRVPFDATFFERDVYRYMQRLGMFTDYMRPGAATIRLVDHNASCNVMYRRGDFLNVGGFSEGLWPGEDVDLDCRLTLAGKTLVCNPKAIVYHHRPKDWHGFLRMMARYGWAQGILLRRFGLFRPIQFAGFLYIALELCLLGLLFFSWRLVTGIVVSMLALAFCYACGNVRLWAMLVSGIKTWKVFFIKGVLFPDAALLGALRRKRDQE